MNQKYISAIAFKLFGIYILVSGIIALPTLLGTLYVDWMYVDSGISYPMSSMFDATSVSDPVGVNIWPIVVIVLLTLLVTAISAKIFWKLGNSVLQDSTQLTNSQENLNIGRLEKTLFTLLGAYLSIIAVFDILLYLTHLFSLKNREQTPISIFDYLRILVLAMQLLIGLSLITKLKNWLSFFRRIGVHEQA